MHACMHVCVYVCSYVCMYVGRYVYVRVLVVFMQRTELSVFSIAFFGRVYVSFFPWTRAEPRTDPKTLRVQGASFWESSNVGWCLGKYVTS